MATVKKPERESIPAKVGELTFRQAQEADFECLCDLLQDLHAKDAPASTAKLKKASKAILKNDGIRHYLAELEGFPVAACHLVIVPNLTRGARPYGVIENVVTRRNTVAKASAHDCFSTH